ncbi:DUF3606 domain-containing protein [Methylobacterium haplocladii]|uniref:DUF3606 domain-containing protein n=1 Tax=Methylobacterium haplocladii TaxID=1176176 RepID=UPI001EE12565|nr:DUF3606 domain-containing protein [Methylobacterium haplocladii]
MDASKTKSGPAFIDTLDRKTRRNWADQLGVTEERLRRSVRIVGPRASTVMAYLGKKLSQDFSLQA